MRSVVAARSRARKEEEKETLRDENAAFQRRLHETGSRTNDNDGIDAHAAANSSERVFLNFNLNY